MAQTKTTNTPKDNLKVATKRKASPVAGAAKATKTVKAVKVTRASKTAKPPKSSGTTKVATAATTRKSTKVDVPAKASKATKPVKRFKTTGTSFDVIPASKVVPSSSARPVIVSSLPIQADNTLVAAELSNDKQSDSGMIAVKVHTKVVSSASPSVPPDVTSNKRARVTDAPRDISSGGDVLLEDIAAKLDKFAAGSTTVAVKTSRSMAGTTPTIPTSTTSNAPSTAGPTVADLLSAQARPQATSAPGPIARQSVAGERKIMPLGKAETDAEVKVTDQADAEPDADAEAEAKPDTAPTLTSSSESLAATPAKPRNHGAKAIDISDVSRPAKTASDSKASGVGVDDIKPDDKAGADAAKKADAGDGGKDGSVDGSIDDKGDDILQGLDLSQDSKPASASGKPDTLPGEAPPAAVVKEPELYGGSSVLLIQESHPGRTALRAVGWFLLFLALALLALNFLLDAGVVSIDYDIPHTDILEPMEPAGQSGLQV